MEISLARALELYNMEQITVHRLTWASFRLVLAPAQLVSAPKVPLPRKKKTTSLAVKLASRAAREAPAPRAATPLSADDQFRLQLTEGRARLKPYALALTRNSTEAEDLLQSTMLLAWKSRAQFEPGSNLQAWLGVILKNNFYSRIRSASTLMNSHTVINSDLLDFSIPDTEKTVTSLLHSEAIVAMSRLPPEMRETAFLALVDQWPYSEIMAHLGVSMGTVKSRLWRAKSILRRMLSE